MTAYVTVGAMSQAVDHVEQGHSWREVGAGPPVLFLHGLGGSRTAWGPQLRGLSDRFRCIAWDMPGYGDAAPLDPLTFSGTAQRLVDLLDHLEIDQVDLVGLSFGGMHAMHTALAFPDRVRRLVLADTSPAFGIDGTTPEAWMNARLEPLDRGEDPADMAEYVIDAITAIRLEGVVREETIEAFGRISADGLRAAVHCLPTNNISDQLQAIGHETMVIVGELDEETPLSYSQLIADGIENSQLHILRGVGHLSPSEAPVAFNTLVADFLSAPPL